MIYGKIRGTCTGIVAEDNGLEVTDRYLKIMTGPFSVEYIYIPKSFSPLSLMKLETHPSEMEVEYSVYGNRKYLHSFQVVRDYPTEEELSEMEESEYEDTDCELPF